MTQSPSNIRFPLISSMLTLVVATGVFAAMAWQGLPLVGGRDLAWQSVVALAICGGFGLIALVPVAVLDRYKAGGAAYGFMLGMLLRLVGCSIVYFALNRNGYPASFAYCMAGAYMLLLMVEIIIIGRFVRHVQLPATSSSTSHAAEVR